ncbi:MAG: redoxin [Idiomarinaceae bacterium]|nr:redoxin [Idiomarinaceae bacterium]
MKIHPLKSFSALGVVVMVLLGLTTTVTQAATVSVEAPDFTLKSRDGDNLRLSEERGNIVIVNFWASWCGPCREELPEFEALYQNYADMGVTVYAVNVDDQSEKANKLLEDISVSFPVLYDPDGEVSELYDVSAMPTTVMIDRDGVARLMHKGYKSGDEAKYEEALHRLLRE